VRLLFEGDDSLDEAKASGESLGEGSGENFGDGEVFAKSFAVDIFKGTLSSFGVDMFKGTLSSFGVNIFKGTLSVWSTVSLGEVRDPSALFMGDCVTGLEAVRRDILSKILVKLNLMSD